MAEVYNFSDLDLTKTYNYSDYLLWKFDERVELIKGFILKMSPTPSLIYQRVSQNLLDCFNENFKRKPCSFFVAPFDVRLPIKSSKKDTTVVQPDLCIICDETKQDEKSCNGTINLIVGIISPNNNNHDIHTKFNIYNEAVALEYWIIEPYDKLLLVYTLKDNDYIGLPPQTKGENIKSPLFPDLNIALEDVYYKI